MARPALRGDGRPAEAVLAEVHKVAGAAFDVAIPAGKYRVLIRTATLIHTCPITVGKGDTGAVELADCDQLALIDTPDDRFKLQVTCAHAAEVFADVVVFDPAPSFPLPSARLRCGNQVVLPGAFRITSDDGAPRPALVCIAIDPDHPPDRAAMVADGPRSPGLGCVQLAPE